MPWKHDLPVVTLPACSARVRHAGGVDAPGLDREASRHVLQGVVLAGRARLPNRAVELVVLVVIDATAHRGGRRELTVGSALLRDRIVRTHVRRRVTATIPDILIETVGARLDRSEGTRPTAGRSPILVNHVTPIDAMV